VVDMITLIVIFGLAIWVHPLALHSASAKLVHRGAAVLMFGAIALAALLVLMERRPGVAEAVVRLVARPLPAGLRSRAEEMLAHFVDGLGLFRDLPRLVWVFFLSFVMFGVFALCLTASMWAFRIEQPWYAGLVMLVVTAIGIMVPAAPGYIGTLHVSCKIGLGLFGVAPEVSVPFSWFFWAGQWIPITLTGLVCLRRQGLSLAALGRAGTAAPE
jgi:glycosyltransferase 2 family protein